MEAEYKFKRTMLSKWPTAQEMPVNDRKRRIPSMGPWQKSVQRINAADSQAVRMAASLQSSVLQAGLHENEFSEYK